MSDSSKTLWAAFFVFLGLGLWAIPAVILVVGLFVFIAYKFPDFYEKYMK